MAVSLRSPLVVRVVSALAVSFALSLASPARAEGPGVRVGVVDVQRAVAQTEDGLRAQATLKKLFESRQQQLDAKQKDLQRQKEEIDKQSRVLSKEALQKRVDEWQKQMIDLQQIFLEYNKELEKKQKELTEPVIEKVMGIIKRIATTENIDIVIGKNTTAYVRTDLDLTDRAIQAYNSGGGGAAPAAPPPKK